MDGHEPNSREGQHIAWCRAGSESDGAHTGGVVPLPGGLGQGVGELIELSGIESHVERGEVLLEVGDAAAAGERDHIVALVQHPGKRELRWGDAVGATQLPEPVGQLQADPEVLLREAGVVAADVGVGQVGAPVPLRPPTTTGTAMLSGEDRSLRPLT